jgi:hypothetical protein
MEFEGPNQGSSSTQKVDLSGAVGPAHIISIRNTGERINTRLYIYNKTGAFTNVIPLQALFSEMYSEFSDIQIVFDNLSKRWIVSSIALKNNAHFLCIAYSSDADPTKEWVEIDAIALNTNISSHKIGFSSRWMVISCYYTDNVLSERTVLYIWKRQEFYEKTNPAHWINFVEDQGSLCPVINYQDKITDLFLVSTYVNPTKGFIKISRIYGSSDSAPLFTSEYAETQIDSTWSDKGSGISQGNSPIEILLSDHRISDAVSRNSSIWFAHTIFLPGINSGRSLIQWGQISLQGTLVQLGRIDGAGSNSNYAAPSIAVDQSENVLLGFNKFSSSGYTSAAYAYHPTSAPSGEMKGVYTYREGSAPIFQKWDTQSSTVLDPVENTMWTLQLYAKSENKWGSLWAKVGNNNSGNCESPCGAANKMWIDQVVLNNQNLPTIGPGTGCTAFNTNAGFYTILKKETNIPISLKAGFETATTSNYPVFWKIWFDLNQDGDFEDVGELFYESAPYFGAILNFNMNIPAYFPKGPVAMRIGMRKHISPPVCGTFENGQILTYNSIYLIENEYCEVEFSQACTREFIQRIKINTLDNISDCGSTGYQDFTSLATTLETGKLYPVELTPGFLSTLIPERWIIWVDLNKDLDFEDPDEKILDSGVIGSPEKILANISIPWKIPTMSTRMRIKMIPAGGNQINLNPCSSIPVSPGINPDEFGEVEDYTVLISGSTIAVDPGTSVGALTDAFLTHSDCNNITDVTFEGQRRQIGWFSNGQSNIGIENGVLLTTGDIDIAVGPNDKNNAFTPNYYNYTSDPDIEQMANSTEIYDLAKLEFKIKPTASPLTFEYVFASEEYCEYVNASKDVFGIFVSGPGVSGAFGGAKNIATLNNGVNVGINTINHISNTGLYVNNTAQGILCGQQAANSDVVNKIQFDGFTKKLTASVDVIPCETYEVKIKLADITDGSHDSGLFIKASDTNAADNALIYWVVNGVKGAGNAYEGCSNVQLVIERNGGGLNTPLPVSLLISGTAVAGIDYTELPLSLTIPSNTNQVTIPVQLLTDVLSEIPETITIKKAGPCFCPEQTLKIFDVPNLISVADTVAVCGEGLITLKANHIGGVYPFTYEWSITGNTDSLLTTYINSSNLYTVTITDACNSSAIKTVYALAHSVPSLSFTLDTFQICTGNTQNIPIKLTGSQPFSVNYSINNITQLEIDNIHDTLFNLTLSKAGEYKIQSLIDRNGCIGSLPGIFVVQSSDLEISESEVTGTCGNENSGAIEIGVSGGKEPYLYSWSENSIGNTANPDELQAETYTVTVTDAFGCSQIKSFSITQLPTPQISFSIVTNINCNTSLGSINLNVIGGTPDYTYQWSNGSNVQNPQGLNAGAYTVTVTDINGCTDIYTTSVVSSSAPQPSISFTPFCEGSYSLLSISNGTFEVYQWSNGENSPTTKIFSPGLYTVTVTDVNQCTGTASIEITPSPLTPEIIGAVELCMGNSTTLTVNGSNYVEISWSTGEMGVSINVDNGGNYIVTVTNTEGCSGTASLHINMYNPQVLILGDSTLCPGQFTNLMASGNISGNISWNDETGQFIGNTEEIMVTQPGTYYLKTEVPFGSIVCLARDTFQVISVPPPIAEANNGLISCAHPNLLIEATPNQADFSYEWSGPGGFTSTAPSNLISVPGIYLLTITNTQGCTDTATSIVTLENKFGTFEILPNMPVISQAPVSLTNAIVPSIIQNNEPDSIKIEWSITQISLQPTDCAVQVQDKNILYPTTIQTGQFTLSPNESAPLNIYMIDSDTTSCTGLIYLKFKNLCTLSDSLETVYSTTVKTTDINNIKIEIYPNPSHGVYTIRNTPSNIKKLEIIGSDGRTIMKHTGTPIDSIDLSRQRPGLYFAVFRNNSEEIIYIATLILTQ